MQRVLFTLVAFLLLLPNLSHAQWQFDGYPISMAPGIQTGPIAVADGAGGIIVVWLDNRTGSTLIYAQRIDKHGSPQWTQNGVAATASPNEPFQMVVASDGAGGCIIAWSDFIQSVIDIDIYAQRIDPSGTLLWGSNGVAVSTATNNQEAPTIVSDGLGGAIVSWSDNRGATGYDIYSQRIDDLGNAAWTADGVELVQANFDQTVPESAPDGLGGAVVTWTDLRNGNFDVYARNISAAGTPMGSSTGRAICTAAGSQFEPRVVNVAAPLASPSNDAIIVWRDDRGANTDVYAQRIITGSSLPQWTADGVLVCGAADGQYSARVIADGVGGAVIAWEDDRGGGTDSDIYAQRIDADASFHWAWNGIAISTGNFVQRFPHARRGWHGRRHHRLGGRAQHSTRVRRFRAACRRLRQPVVELCRSSADGRGKRSGARDDRQ